MRAKSWIFSGVLALLAAGAVGAQAQTGKSLWIAKFQCETKAAQAVAATQQGDFSALEYSSLFARVAMFTTEPTAPSGVWTLTGKEVDYSHGSAAKRALIGWGTGRAHLVMEYELHDPSGKVVWTKKIKSEPSFWGASGDFGAVQNQSAAVGKQGQDMVNALGKFFQGVGGKAN